MDYLQKISSLEKRASAQVAINLCQKNGFKEVAMCLEKPTYGALIHVYARLLFVSDPEKLSTWAKMKEAKVKKDDPSFDAFKRSIYIDDYEKIEQFDAAIDEECQRLTESLPHLLKQGVQAWINFIAWEYLSYTRRQETVFGVSRYFLMDVLTRGDWKEAGELDEKKIAERLLKDQRLTVLQRYRIACVYCLHRYIPRLWKRLTLEEKQSISGNDDPSLSQESHSLVLLWSYQMDGHREKKVTGRKIRPEIYAAKEAVYYGNRVALMSCWKIFEEDIRQGIVMDMALQSLQTWQSIPIKSLAYNNWKATLLRNDYPYAQYHYCIRYFNKPSYYSELIRFFLSQMDEEQQLTFHVKAYKNCCDSFVKWLLDWPHQDDFLLTINRLWGIIPKSKYAQCLLTLGSKYCGDDEKENRYYDYRSLLWTLWEETPEEYKRHLFLDRKPNGNLVINKSTVLLPRLLERSPFQEKDEALFKLFFSDISQEERRAMMRSKVGDNICSILAQKERWSFVNWLIEECFTKEEIPSFKKRFIQSYYGRKLCLYNLEENREKLTKDLIDWSLELDTEKTKFKHELVRKRDCLQLCESLLRTGEFTKVESIINFCLSSDEKKKRYKERLAKDICSGLLKDCAWELMNEILAWSLDSEEKIRGLKKYLFSVKGYNIHYTLVFIQGQWEEVEHFYKWFGLLPKEIEKLKKDTIFSPLVIDSVYRGLYDYTNTSVAPLLWCLTDVEMVLSLKRQIEQIYFKHVLDTKLKAEKELLDYLVSELLNSFRKEFQGKTLRADNFRRVVKSFRRMVTRGTLAENGTKRSSVIEDESSTPRKRYKQDL